MTHWLNLFQRHDAYHWLDHTKSDFIYGKPNTAVTSFAIDDALATAVGKGDTPAVIRLWTHNDTIVMGIPDVRLPDLKSGIKLLNQHGFKAVVRNSGGLAVALDAGVLNISLIFPDARHLSIDEGYDAMVRFTRDMFADLTDAIEAYEIVGSYCPGDYDLSINGLKFAGISQRRVRNAVAVQIYLDIFGNSLKRAELIRDFYNQATGEATTTFTYPTITPTVMGSLNHLLDVELTLEDVKRRADHILKTSGLIGHKDSETIFDPDVFEKRYTQMQQRNADIAAIQTK